MKRLYKLLTGVLLLFTTGLNAQVLISASFEEQHFPPRVVFGGIVISSWGLISGSGSDWVQSNGSENYLNLHISAHSGTKMARFTSNRSNSSSQLITPAFSLNDTSICAKAVSFWIYRDSAFNTERLDVRINSTARLSGSVLLGRVYPKATKTPVVSTGGWYQYTFAIPATFKSTTSYIIFNGISSSAGLSRIYVDDVSVEVNSSSPVAMLQNPYREICPGGGTSFSVSATGVMLSYQWQVYNGSTWTNLANTGIYSGAKTATLSITSATTVVNNYRYRCIVSNSCGSSISNYAGVLSVAKRTWYKDSDGDGWGSPYASLMDCVQPPGYVLNNQDCNDTNFNHSKFSTVGVAGFSAGIVTYKHMAIDGSGTPYMVYTDHANGNKVTVKKYNGSAWVTVGSAGFSAGAAQYNQIAIDATGTPYVVYADGTNNNKAAVKKYNGTTWATVGAAGFSAAGAEYLGLAIDADGTPYVAYRDSINNYKATVMKYNGTAWVAVGTPGFSSGSLKGYICIAINKAGEPYVLYSEGHLTNTKLVIGNQVVVKRYNGTTWETVGESSMQNTNSDFARLAIDHSGVPYIAYISQSSPYGTLPAMVKRFEDTSWKAVGSTFIGSLPAYNVHYLDISTDDAGNPYLYYDQGVKKFDGTSWKLIGDVPGIVKSGADKTTYLAVDGAGVPYVAGSTINDQAIVQKLELVDVKPVITAQPASDTLCAGGIATYKMVANNAYHYQWQVSTNGGSTFTDVINSTFYSGVTTDSLTIIAPGASYNNNQYRCVVTGTCALMDTTVAANLFVHTPPAITSQPVNRNICPGTITTFHVGATGTGLKFRWKVNTGSSWTNVPNTGIYSGANSATLTLNAPNASYNGYKYRCLVSGTCTPSVNSAVATLTVSTPVIVATPIMSPNPTVTGQASNTIFLGYGPSSATLTSTVSGGTPGYTYSWTPTTGVASPAAASTLVTPVASTVYTLTATDTKGCIGSSDFNISVVDARGTNNRIIVCHNGTTISVATSRIANHLSHGDYLGPCTSSNKNNSTGSDGNDETGIGTFENLKVYPNPNDGHFTIELPEGVGGGTIVIADVFGKLVKKISFEQQSQLVVDLGSVANGVYMVQVQDNDKIYRAMVTVKN